MGDASFYVLPVRLTILIWTVLPAPYRCVPTGQVLLCTPTAQVAGREPSQSQKQSVRSRAPARVTSMGSSAV